MSRGNLFQQVEFERTVDSKSTKKLVWVEVSWDLKKGHRVRFYDEPKGSPLWKVTKVYKTEMWAEAIHHKWGLDLPKSQRTER